jgi:hypothetical protein
VALILRKPASISTEESKELAELEPSPFDFRFQFEDDAGQHNYQTVTGRRT